MENISKLTTNALLLLFRSLFLDHFSIYFNIVHGTQLFPVVQFTYINTANKWECKFCTFNYSPLFDKPELPHTPPLSRWLIDHEYENKSVIAGLIYASSFEVYFLLFIPSESLHIFIYIYIYYISWKPMKQLRFFILTFPNENLLYLLLMTFNFN